MALDCSYDPIFGKSQLSSIQLGNRYVFEECQDKSFDRVANYWGFSFEFKNSREKGEKNDKVCDDIVDLLPSDPFGMDISATFTAISSWIEELSSLGFVMDETEVKMAGDDQMFSGSNLVWNGAMRFDGESPDEKGYGKLVGSGTDKTLMEGLHGNPFLFNGNESLGLNFNGLRVSGNSINECQSCTKDSSDGGKEGAPHDALFFALGYLGVKDLLSAERVCKSFHNAVKNDSLLWRDIHIDRQLNDKISDDTLFQLSSRAQGSLRSLSLVECLKITDDGLKRVLESNPRLTKLSVPGCIRLSVEGILCSLKVSKSTGATGIKNLRIGGLFGVTNDHFEELKSLLEVDKDKPLHANQPRFYQGGQMYLPFDDDRAIDIEACPRCQQLRQVYDCPAASCQGEHQATCRACTLCVARCVNCGCCIKERDYEETFSLDFLCMGCSEAV